MVSESKLSCGNSTPDVPDDTEPIEHYSWFSLILNNSQTQSDLHRVPGLRLIARKIEDLTWMLGDLATRSRNFH